MRSLSTQITLSLFLSGVVGLCIFGGHSFADSHTNRVEMTMQDEAAMTDIQRSFPGASMEILEVAGKIASGTAITADDLLDLDKDEINELWPNPVLAKQKGAGQSLLRLAVESRNIPAIYTLLDAGADPFYNDNEWPFQAIRMFQGSQLVWFPDYSPGVELLQIWLDQGGDPNARCRYWSGPLLNAINHSNLEGILTLLDAGADPWLRPQSDVRPESFHDSFFEWLANTTLQDNEVAFRVAQKGFYEAPPPEALPGLIEQYDRAARMIVGASGTENLWRAWTMQQALSLILEQTGAQPTPMISELLAMQIPPDIGGFFLAPGEIRSPNDEDQQARTDNQAGTERWGR